MERTKKIIQVSVVGIIVNLLLSGFKAVIGLITGSVAITMDAVNNLSDALSSVITIIGTKLAGKAPNKKHPYGYGQIEYISSITIAIIIVLAGVTSFFESLDKIVNPVSATYTAIPLLIIAAAVVVKFILGTFVKNAGKKYNSESLVASGTDAFFDAVISLSTLATAGVSVLFNLSIEGYLGVIIAIIIVKAGVEILLESLGNIIGKRIDSEMSHKLKGIIKSKPEVHGVYDLILNRYGPERIIGSVHIEVDDKLTAREIYILTRDISSEIYDKFGIIITVGIYAANTGDGICSDMKTFLDNTIKDYHDVLNVHGFYADYATKRVTFDIVIDFRNTEHEKIRDEIIAKLKSCYPEFTFNAILDNDFSD